MAKLKAQVVKEEKVIGYVLGNGKRITMWEAVKMAKDGKIPGVHAVRPQGGRPYIRTDADGKERNNLEKLPKVE